MTSEYIYSFNTHRDELFSQRCSAIFIFFPSLNCRNIGRLQAEIQFLFRKKNYIIVSIFDIAKKVSGHLKHIRGQSAKAYVNGVIE